MIDNDILGGEKIDKTEAKNDKHKWKSCGTKYDESKLYIDHLSKMFKALYLNLDVNRPTNLS